MQVRVYMLAPAVVGETIDWPLVAALLLQLAVQEVALLADHESLALWPATMVVGCTLREIVGFTAGDMEPPPYPPHDASITARAAGTRRMSRSGCILLPVARMAHLPSAHAVAIEAYDAVDPWVCCAAAQVR